MEEVCVAESQNELMLLGVVFSEGPFQRTSLFNAWIEALSVILHQDFLTASSVASPFHSSLVHHPTQNPLPLRSERVWPSAAS